MHVIMSSNHQNKWLMLKTEMERVSAKGGDHIWHYTLENQHLADHTKCPEQKFGLFVVFLSKIVFPLSGFESRCQQSAWLSEVSEASAAKMLLSGLHWECGSELSRDRLVRGRHPCTAWQPFWMSVPRSPPARYRAGPYAPVKQALSRC